MTIRPELLKPKSYRNREYMLWIKLWPCLVCGDERTEAAHTGSHGLGTKASDFRCLPLCEIHHRDDTRGLDKLGPEKFELRYNVNLREEVLRRIEAWLGSWHSL